MAVENISNEWHDTITVSVHKKGSHRNDFSNKLIKITKVSVETWEPKSELKGL